VNFKYVQNYFEDETLKEYTFLLYSGIGFGGIDGQAFAQELSYIASLEEVETIHVRLCSSGGSVIDGMAIISAMLNCKKTIITYADGLVASIASLIFLCGDITMMWDCAILMFHNTSGASAEVLENFNAVLNNLYQKRLGRSAEEVKAWMDKTTFFLPAEAKELGLVDQVFETALKVKYQEEVELVEENVTALLDLYVQNLAHFEGNANLKITQVDMIKNELVELFKLDTSVEDATLVEQVQNLLTQVATLTELQNTLVLKDTELEAVKNQLVEKDTMLTEKETEITGLATKVDEKEQAVIELTNQVTEYQAEDVKRQDEKVNALVEGALVANKITAVEKEDWLDFAKKDYTRTEKLLNSLRPVRTKLSDRMEIENNAGVNDNTFAARMKEIEAKAKGKK